MKNPVSFKHTVNRFLRDERGVALVEFAICLPLMILLLAGAVVLQDLIRIGYLNSKASYTLSDLVSREDTSIDAPYFNGLDNVFEFIVPDRNPPLPTDLRITTIECTSNCEDEANRVLEVCWSESSPGFSDLTTEQMEDYLPRVPLFVEGDTMIMTETFVVYTPPAFERFFEPRRYDSKTFTRPRVTEQVKFDTGLTDEDGDPIFKDCFNNDIS